MDAEHVLRAQLCGTDIEAWRRRGHGLGTSFAPTKPETSRRSFLLPSWQPFDVEDDSQAFLGQQGVYGLSTSLQSVSLAATCLGAVTFS
jgi:hypothetical protein